MSDASRFLPLSTQQFHILLTLTAGHRHGYGIIRDIAARTGLRLGTGTLYTALARLAALGLIDESSRRAPAAADDERRRYYRLTPLGRDVLTVETARLEAMVSQAHQRGVRPPRRPAFDNPGPALGRPAGSRTR